MGAEGGFEPPCGAAGHTVVRLGDQSVGNSLNDSLLMSRRSPLGCCRSAPEARAPAELADEHGLAFRVGDERLEKRTGIRIPRTIIWSML